MTEARFSQIAKIRFEADLAVQTMTDRKIASSFCRLAGDLAHELMESHATDRKGPWTVTYTGRRIWPEDPRPEDFDIVDIAHKFSARGPSPLGDGGIAASGVDWTNRPM